MALPLLGRTALVTGASRVRGIGAATARRLASLGASVVLHHHQPHDAEQPWGADDIADVVESVRQQPGADVFDIPFDLGQRNAGDVIDRAIDAAGPLDILVCNQARSGGDGRLLDLTVDELDGHWSVNARATLLLTAEFARRHDPQRPGGRVVWLTSGQALGPMPGEVAYAASKAALAGVTRTVADELIELGIGLNTVNPGPVNTGYLDAGMGIPDVDLERVAASFPSGQLPDAGDPARLIAWLVTDDARAIVGEVLNSESGFRRWN